MLLSGNFYIFSKHVVFLSYEQLDLCLLLFLQLFCSDVWVLPIIYHQVSGHSI